MLEFYSDCEYNTNCLIELFFMKLISWLKGDGTCITSEVSSEKSWQEFTNPVYLASGI